MQSHTFLTFWVELCLTNLCSNTVPLFSLQILTLNSILLSKPNVSMFFASGLVRVMQFLGEIHVQVQCHRRLRIRLTLNKMRVIAPLRNACTIHPSSTHYSVFKTSRFLTPSFLTFSAATTSSTILFQCEPHQPSDEAVVLPAVSNRSFPTIVAYRTELRSLSPSSTLPARNCESKVSLATYRLHRQPHLTHWLLINHLNFSLTRSIAAWNDGHTRLLSATIVANPVCHRPWTEVTGTVYLRQLISSSTSFFLSLFTASRTRL